MIRVANNKNGMALLICLAIIAVLAAAGLELGKRVRSATDHAIVLQDSFRAEEMALAGINLAMLLLEEDANANETDSVQETWADPEELGSAIASLGYDTGNMTLSITDELGKIQINALLNEFPGHDFNTDQQQFWERFLALLISADKSEDTRSPVEIINCIKDWLDSKDDDLETGLSGAESAYYQALDPPYACANGPFDILDEIFLVKGVSKDMLTHEAIEGFEEEENEPLGFSEAFTVFGMDDIVPEKGRYRFPGTININTANETILAALLPSGMEDQAGELAEYRVEKQEETGNFVNTLDKGWYKTVIDLSEKEKKRFDRLIRYSSHIFKAECSATVGKTEKTIIACINRKKDKKTKRWTCETIRLLRN
ncbi:MAG: general secretion pathway protein GspK [Desulfobacteraceae bacterium]|nr:general secretion pathway protein GspK [Desulfobacteraceae bacterium]